MISMKFMLLLLVQYEVINTCAEAAQAGSCSACNCQFNNVGILKDLVESLVNRSLDIRLPAAVNVAVDSQLQSVQQQLHDRIVDSQRDIPVFKIASISRSSFYTVKLINISSYNFVRDTVVATIDNFDPSISYTIGNILAYHPNFTDAHASGLAGMFVNIEELFPCTVGYPEYFPVCKLFTYDEDGFRRGHATIETADHGNHIHVFNGTNIATYGFAFTGCPIFTGPECFPSLVDYSIVCLLPRDRCG